MHAVVALLFFLVQPFWETKPPEKWTDEEVGIVLTASPWIGHTRGEAASTVYFATAGPIQQAEAELRRRSKNEPPDPDYVDYLQEHRDEVFVLAIAYAKPVPLSAVEIRRMDEQTEMKIGKKPYRILGHFAPTPADPVLRLVFPRTVKATDKLVEFKLYVPGLPFPERDVSFYVQDLLFRGTLEM
ncbi:MAG TPA: hypothetical protein VG456_00600 [Candidatus Sulfopaludibacter sp.]|jgi:hypothetical protein|nr:hypothetical protein [Candidatus Sulfopaludibacter sp.]